MALDGAGLKLVCLNGWGGKLHEPLRDYLVDETPDVLCLQEVVHSPASDLDWLTYRDGDHILPQRANFFRDICDALPDHVAIFCPAAQGVLWEGDVSVPSQWGLATFVRNSFPIIAQAQGFVHGVYGVDGYGAHPRSRAAHGVRIWDYDARRPVSIAHMHGLRDLAGKHDTPARADQARRFADLTRQVAEPGDALVLCGDFNVEAESETLDILKTVASRELVTEGGFQGTRTARYKKPGKFADYMLVNDAVVVSRFDVVRSPEVSDHCPLVLEF